MVNAQQQRINKIIWLLVFIVLIVDVSWGIALGIGFNSRLLYLLTGIIIMLGAIRWFYGYKRPEPNIALILEIIAQAVLFSNLAATLSYLSATIALPFYDEWFNKADLMLGFDWRKYVDAVDNIPYAEHILSIAYTSMGAQFVFMILWLFITRNLHRLQQLMLASAICALTAIAVSTVFPAMCAYLYYNIVGIQIEVADLTLLRSGQLQQLPMTFQGIIQFPSFHAALGIMFIYATWPFLWLRGIFLILNILLLVSTLSVGGHYLVDVLAGCAMAILVLYSVRRIFPMREGLQSQPCS